MRSRGHGAAQPSSRARRAPIGRPPASSQRLHARLRVRRARAPPRPPARLIAAIARAPQGAVVLPDLDLNLDDRSWAMIGASEDASLGLAGHPQALLHPLSGAIGGKREDVMTLGARSPALEARSAFLSEALRPAESTDLWRERGWTLSPLALAAAFQGVTILVADNENEKESGR